MRISWSNYLRVRTWNTTPVPYRSQPLWVGSLHPQYPQQDSSERKATSRLNRLRSCHHAPHAQPGTSSIPELLRLVWCDIKGRVQSGGPEFKSLALLLTYSVCGQIIAPLWLCFSTYKMDTIRLWGSNEKMYIKGSTHSKSATGSYYLTQAEANCHWVKLKLDSLKKKSVSWS